jgi:hypothetical protein
VHVVSPNDMKFLGKIHLPGVDHSCFLQGLQYVSYHSGDPRVVNLPRSRCVRKDLREPDPRRTWHARQMLAGQMLGPAIFGKYFANTRFGLKFQSFQERNKRLG